MQSISINIPQSSPIDVAELHRAIEDKRLIEPSLPASDLSTSSCLVRALNNCSEIVQTHSGATTGALIGGAIGTLGSVILLCIAAYSSHANIDVYAFPCLGTGFITSTIIGAIIGEVHSRIAHSEAEELLNVLDVSCPPPAYGTIGVEQPLPPHYEDLSFSDDGSDSEEFSDTRSINSLLSTVTVISECD